MHPGALLGTRPDAVKTALSDPQLDSCMVFM